MKRYFWVALFFATPAFPANITATWFGNGTQKIAMEDRYPQNNFSTNTITRNWDGTTAKLLGLKGESVGGMLTLINQSAAEATSVNVTLAPFYLSGSLAISSTGTLCAATTNYTNRPYEIFVATYVPIQGMTTLSWDPSQYEMRDQPYGMRNACTVNVNNDCIPSGSNLWTTRKQANKYLPDALIPKECVSTFTVHKSSSQGIWVDVYIDPSLTAGTYTSTFTVTEGVSISTQIPVQLLVYNATLPITPALPVIADVSTDDIDFRQNGISHGFGCTSAACKATRRHYYQMLHKHGVIPIGDTPDVSTNFYPSTEYAAMLNGSLFSATSGYYGRGVSTGTPVSSIGTYAHWTDNPNWSQTNSALFCTAVSSWGAYFHDNYPTVRSFVYLRDEDLTNVDRWSTWMSTVSACQTSGYHVGSFVTSNWPETNSTTSNLDWPASTNWTQSGKTITDWQTASTKYCTTGNFQCYGYNGHPSWGGTMYATEDDGVSAMMFGPAAWKKSVSGWFLWQTTNWYNPGNQVPAENNVWDYSKTFGYDTSSNASTGRTGFNYANGDGVLLYPGTDTVFSSHSWHIDGPIATVRLKYVRNGINLYDYMKMAYAVDATSTTALVAAVLPEILYEHQCFTAADCTYSYGGRQFSENPGTWETLRENLALTITSGSSPTPPSSATGFSGQAKGSVRVKGQGRFK